MTQPRDRLLHFVIELRRRRVFRVVTAYVVMGLGVIYAADVILPRLAAPEWAVTLVIVLIALGFVVAVGLAWAFDVTATGVVWTEPAGVATSKNGAAAGTGNGEARRLDRRAIAVLPFENMSADAENEFFSDGIAEEIINALAQLPELRVAGRTSAFSFKGKNQDLRLIGQQLNVGTVLEGSVRRAGNRVRITAQLIDANDGYHLWSERYDRDLHDIFVVQDEIAREVAVRLAHQLQARAAAPLITQPAVDPDAYQHYLKGRHYYSRLMEPGFSLAVAEYERALELAPDYAMAYAALGECLTTRAFIMDEPYGGSPSRARTAARKALALNEAIGEAHAILGALLTYYDLDWEGAEHEFRRALALSPGSAGIRTWYGDFLTYTRRHDEALAEARRALELEPLSPMVRWNLVQDLWMAGRLEEAEQEVALGLQLFPDLYILHFLRSAIAWSRGDGTQALASIDRAVELMGGDSMLDAGRVAAYYRFGDPARADELFRKLRERSQREHVSAAWLALIHVCRGETNEAIEQLRIGRRNRDTFFAAFKASLHALNLPVEPALAQELERLGFP